MNLVIDDAVEVQQATKNDSEEKRRTLGMDLFYRQTIDYLIYVTGQILLKGDNVSLIQALQ